MPSANPIAAAPTAIPPPASSRWAVDLVLLAALWGASFLFMRVGAAEFGALPAAAVRVAIAAAFLIPVMLLRGAGGALRQHWKPTLAIGVINSGIPFALFCFALLTINSGLASVLNATVPMFGALVAWVWFKDRPDNARLLGLAIGFVGVAMLASRTAGFQAEAGNEWAGLLAVLACLGACLSYGVSASATRRYLTGVPALATATGSQVGATLFLVLPAIVLWPTKMPSLQAWLALAVLGVASTGIAYILFFRLIATAGPVRALTVTFLVPVFAVFYGVVFLDERVTHWMMLCAAIIVCGVALATGLVRPGRRRAVST